MTRTLLGSALLVAVALLFALPLSAAAATSRQTATTHVTVLAGKPSEFGFKLSTKTVRRGKVVFKVENKGALVHTFKICASPKGGHRNACKGKVTKSISPGASTTLTYTFKKKGVYEYLCTVAGHAAAGMKGDLRVK